MGRGGGSGKGRRQGEGSAGVKERNRTHYCILKLYSKAG